MKFENAKNLFSRKTLSGDNLIDRILLKQNNEPSYELLGYKPITIKDLYLTDYSKLSSMCSSSNSFNIAIQAILKWSDIIIEHIKQNDSNLILNSLNELESFIRMLYNLDITNLRKFDFIYYRKLIAYCSLLNSSKKLKRIKNFQDMSIRWSNKKFTEYGYYMEINNQLRNFSQYYYNIVSDGKENILLNVLCFDTAP